LQAFEPPIKWKEGTMEGEVTLRTTMNVWEKWRVLQRTTLVAHLQMEPVTIRDAWGDGEHSR
jgi:hypothetical protein